MESQTNQNARNKGRPMDFAFRYEFHSGNSTPTRYYEYVIELAPDGSGEIHFRRDKEANRPEEFVALFDPEEEKLHKVYLLMLSAGICEPFWQPPRRRERPAGNVSRLEVTCGGSCFDVSPGRFEAMDEMGDSLHEAIRELVPENTWTKIDAFKRPEE